MAEKVSAAASIVGVMAKIDAVGKTGHNRDQNYDFRGIDAVINAVGPALREVGGFFVPTLLKSKREHGVSKNGTPLTDTIVKVRYAWFGTDGGEPITATVEGESRDTSDKGTAKAMSVAERTFLIQILCLPTDEPDPDEEHIERAPAGTKPQVSTGPLPEPKPAGKPPMAKSEWASKIIDALGKDAAMRAVWDAAEEAGELGLRFPAVQWRLIESAAAIYTRDEKLPRDATVAQIINKARGWDPEATEGES